jgi:alkylation response protein AidB-like acyl-CoA dehydrogenase
VVPDALAGKKTMCLAITEPYGGSDVAGVRTSAQKDDNGDYIVCGEKKFITGGAAHAWRVPAGRGRVCCYLERVPARRGRV